MVLCTVVGCPSRSMPSTHGGKHFFRFPKENDRNKQIRKLWCQFSRREKDFDPKSSAICEDHFTPESFIQKKKGRLYLHKHSVPTIYYRETKQKLEKIEVKKNNEKYFSLPNEILMVMNIFCYIYRFHTTLTRKNTFALIKLNSFMLQRMSSASKRFFTRGK